MSREMRKSAKAVDIIHSHGLWIAPNAYAGQVSAYRGKPLVVSPRGMLAPGALQFSRLKKLVIWKLWQGPAYRNAAFWHATSRQEADEIRAFGIQAPIAVIPNGVDLNDRLALHALRKPQRTILFLSRIHPKKGLPVLIQAWEKLSRDRPDWQLVIAGPDEGGHRASLQATIRQRRISRITFLDPVYGEAKDALLADADLFVLPTISENFGIAVAEALGAGLPAVVTRGAPWQGLHSHNCGWWVEQGVEPLLTALAEATAISASERKAMGLRGRDWMRRDFGWEAIGQQMAAVYRWITGIGERPACVHIK
jgi:glycosyltransferase involved in cell wall biosynthesis